MQDLSDVLFYLSITKMDTTKHDFEGDDILECELCGHSLRAPVHRYSMQPRTNSTYQIRESMRRGRRG